MTKTSRREFLGAATAMAFAPLMEHEAAPMLLGCKDVIHGHWLNVTAWTPCGGVPNYWNDGKLCQCEGRCGEVQFSAEFLRKHPGFSPRMLVRDIREIGHEERVSGLLICSPSVSLHHFTFDVPTSWSTQ